MTKLLAPAPQTGLLDWPGVRLAILAKRPPGKPVSAPSVPSPVVPVWEPVMLTLTTEEHLRLRLAVAIVCSSLSLFLAIPPSVQVRIAASEFVKLVYLVLIFPASLAILALRA